MFKGKYKQWSGYNPNNRTIYAERIIFDNAFISEDEVPYIPVTGAAQNIKHRKEVFFETEFTDKYSYIAESGYTQFEYHWRSKDDIPVFKPQIPVLDDSPGQNIGYAVMFFAAGVALIIWAAVKL